MTSSIVEASVEETNSSFLSGSTDCSLSGSLPPHFGDSLEITSRILYSPDEEVKTPSLDSYSERLQSESIVVEKKSKHEDSAQDIGETVVEMESQSVIQKTFDAHRRKIEKIKDHEYDSSEDLKTLTLGSQTTQNEASHLAENNKLGGSLQAIARMQQRFQQEALNTLNEFAEKLKSENDKLQSQQCYYKRFYQELKQEVSVCQEGLCRNEKQKANVKRNAFFDVKTSELENEQKKLDALKTQIEDLIVKNTELKNILLEVEIKPEEINDLRKAVVEVHSTIEKMKSDYDAQVRWHSLTVDKLEEDNKMLRHKIAEVNKSNNNQSNGSLMKHLATVQMSINMLQSQRNDRLAFIRNMEKEIKQLNDSLENRRHDTNNSAELEIELKTYKTAFDEERSQKDLAQTEKEYICHKMFLIQQKNQQLADEIERLKDAEYPFKCPKCNARYKDVKPLEDHVSICLSEDSS